jgi:hypothetical protein
MLSQKPFNAELRREGAKFRTAIFLKFNPLRFSALLLCGSQRLDFVVLRLPLIINVIENKNPQSINL